MKVNSFVNWMDFHARQYDPQIGRFLGVDPLADGGGQERFSPYAAMGNSPRMMVDPGGMKFEGWRTPTSEIPIIGLTGFFPSSFTKSSYAMEMLKDQMKDPSKAYLDAVSVLIANIVFGNIGVSSGIVSNFGAGGGGGGGDKKDENERSSTNPQNDKKKKSDEVHSGFPGDGHIHIINDYKGDVYFKPESDLKLNDFEFKNDSVYKVGAKSWVPLDGVNVNRKVYKISDGYDRIHITETGEVKVLYLLPIPQFINWILGGKKSTSPGDSWDNLFNVNNR